MIGSIPSGLWIGRAVRGVDVREMGSRRTGATNVQRSLGWKLGVAVLLADLMKGLLAVLLVRAVTGDDHLAVIGGTAAIIGHIWPVLADFRGGRGVATGAGALLAFSPLGLLLIIVLMSLVVALTRYVSLGSIVACLSAGIIVALLHGGDGAILMALVTGGLVLSRHADNLERLRHGREARLGQKAGSSPNTHEAVLRSE
jgi:glycerol-3-phosphate acyltransferase PlsY